MNVTTNDNAVIMWQTEPPDGYGLPEPALLFDLTSDAFTVYQERRYLTINYESIDEMIKILRQVKRDRPKDK